MKGVWQLCPVCSATDAFLCKRVSRQHVFLALIPLLIVAFGLMAYHWLLGIALLVGLTLLDALLHFLLPNMLVCYGCQSEFFIENDDLKKAQYATYSHHVAENYRQRKKTS